MRHWFLFLAAGSLACSSTVKNSVSDAQDSDEGATSSSSDGAVVGTTGEAGPKEVSAASSQGATVSTGSGGSGGSDGSSAIQGDSTTSTTRSATVGSGGAPDATTSTTGAQDTVSTTSTTGTTGANCPSFCKDEACSVTSTDENHGCTADSYMCGTHRGYVVDDGTEIPCEDTADWFDCSVAVETLNEYWAACEGEEPDPEPEPEDFGCEDLDIYLRCGVNARWRIWSPDSTECATGQLQTTATCYPEEFNGAITYDVPEGHCLVVHGANSKYHDDQCSPVGTTLPNPYGGIKGGQVVTLAFTGNAPEVHMYRDTLGLCPYVGGSDIVPDSQCGVHPGLDGPCGVNADQAEAGCQSCPVDSSGAQIDPDAIGCQ